MEVTVVDYRKFQNRVIATCVLLSCLLVLPANAGDRLFVDQQRLTVDKLIQAVLSRNPTLQAQHAAWEADRARIKQARGLPDPMLRYTVAPDTRNVPGLDFGYKWQLSQRIPWPGKRRLRGQAAQRDAEASHEKVAAIRLQLVAATRMAFADWYYAHESIRINRINLGLWAGFRSVAKLRYANGIASKQDALRAEVEHHKLELQAIVLKRQLQAVQTRINALLHRAPDLPLPLPVTLTDPGRLRPVNVLRAAALTQHPGLRATAKRIDAAKARTRLARRNYYPDFTFTIGHNTLWNQKEKRSTVGIGINIPLYRGKRRATVQQARAKLRETEWRLRERTVQVQAAVQQAFDRVQESRQVLKLYRDRLLPVAEANLEAAIADYQSGSGDFLTLVTAEKNLIQTQLRTAQALADYHRYLAYLARLVGGPIYLVSDSIPRGKKP